MSYLCNSKFHHGTPLNDAYHGGTSLLYGYIVYDKDTNSPTLTFMEVPEIYTWEARILNLRKRKEETSYLSALVIIYNNLRKFREGLQYPQWP